MINLPEKRWIWPEGKTSVALELAQELDLPLALARLLINRGLEDPQKARAFLSPGLEQLHDPLLMLGMDRALKRLFTAFERGEKVTVYGDYDADGITAAALMVEALRCCGQEADFYLPSRFGDGYGLSSTALKDLKEKGTDLVISVDCGTNAAEEALYAKSIGLDLLITDHHLSLAAMPEDLIIINPLQKNCPYPFKELSGAGVAFKLATALFAKSGQPFPEALLDLAALGTAADVMPLFDENRALVALGLEVLKKEKRPGLKALAELCGLKKEKFNSSALSFVFAPHLNAAGRLGDALPAMEMLLAEEEEKAALLANELCQINQKRRALERKILQQAESQAEEEIKKTKTSLLTLAAEDWHRGVIGIVASRLAEKYYRPVALVALDGDEGHGSARSIPGFDITKALSASSRLLARFGGHEQAAGFSVPKENIAPLRGSLNRYAAENLSAETLQPSLDIEAELGPDEISFELADHLELLEPFGEGNPTPILGTRSWELSSWRLVGADQSHLKLSVKKGGKHLAPIYFSAAAKEPGLSQNEPIDFAFRLKTGFFNRQKTLDVVVKALQPSKIEHSSSLKVTDQRENPDRDAALENLLQGYPGETVIFCATLASKNRLLEKFKPGVSHQFITNGRFKDFALKKTPLKRLVLYELPLDKVILEPALKALLKSEAPEIFLLYRSEDRTLSTRLLDHSMPNARHIRQVAEYFLEKGEAGILEEEQVVLAQKIGFKPAPLFWQRLSAIIKEAGLGGHLKNKATGSAFLKELSAMLEASSTFSSLQKRRSSCERFQSILLHAPAGELNKYFSSSFF